MDASNSVHEQRRSSSAHLNHSLTAADSSLAPTASEDSNYAAYTTDYQSQGHFALGPTYTDFQQEQAAQLMSHTSNSFLQLQDYSSQAGNQLSHGINESSTFPPLDFSLNGYDQTASMDPTLLDALTSNTLDPKLADPMASALSSHSPTPPHLSPGMASRRHSGSPSPHASPNSQQVAPYPSMNGRPRNLSESLGPSSAMFPQGQGGEWSAMGSYRRAHHRSPSDNYSDVSSTQNSPYMGNLDSFDAHTSPMLNSTDPSFGNDLGMQGFTLNENILTNQHNIHGHSPGHSPQPSPQLSAQRQLPIAFTSDNGYGLNPTMNGQYVQPQQNSLEMYSGGGHEQFPSLNGHLSPGGELGLADQMSPPEINIDFAPPSRDPIEQVRSVNGGDDTLSPPTRSTVNRTRSASASQAGTRPMSPNFTRRGRSPSLQEQQSVSLSPFDNNVTSTSSSRSQSPARVRNDSIGSRARSHSASGNSTYILDLIDPARSSSSAPSTRVQRHPANFQCSLCPKRFTRAYNLRSHLRTHTDERPFVCTVCGKAFARQHDRKRHEGLHSGEKKFVCRGTLQSGSQWGCSRRFARADALGRHFRSEAGRICIKPLLDEEAAERQKLWMQDHQMAQQQGLGIHQPLLNPQQPQLDVLDGFLPQALLQQYPALAGLDWTTIPHGNPPDEGDISGRSSFDASSGGEYYDDLSETEMSTAYPDPQQGGMNDMDINGMNVALSQQQMNGMAQQQHFPVAGYGGSTTGDYLSDFEGR